jgi:hypothetical protein
MTGKKTKLYLGSATAEHIESDPDRIYWLIVYKNPSGVSRALTTCRAGPNPSE